MDESGETILRLRAERAKLESLYESSKGEIARLMALKGDGDGELNEKLKDCGEAAKLAIAGLIMFREDAESERDVYKKALTEIAAIRPTGDGALMKAQNIADEALHF